MTRCRQRTAPVESYDTPFVVGQMAERRRGHLGPSQLWRPMEFRGFLVAAEKVLLEDDNDEPTLFWVRPGPTAVPVHQRSPIVWLLLAKWSVLFGEHRGACVAHHAAPALVIDVHRGTCPGPEWYAACGGPGCFESAVDQALRLVVLRLASAYRSPHIPRRLRPL